MTTKRPKRQAMVDKIPSKKNISPVKIWGELTLYTISRKYQCKAKFWFGTTIYMYITNLVCYTYFHWFFKPECQHIFGKQTGYIFQSPNTIKTWTTKHYASLNQWYNTE